MNRRFSAWLAWLSVLALVVVALLEVRVGLDQASVALALLLVVLGGSARGGRPLGFTLAFLCFVLFNFLFQMPFDSLGVERAVDWVVLVSFLTTAAVSAQLLGRANAEAEAAHQRAQEIDRLSAMGAEALSVGRAEDALFAIARVVRETTGAERAEIHGVDAAGALRLLASATGPGRGAAPEPPAVLAAVVGDRRGAVLRGSEVLQASAEGAVGAMALDLAGVQELLLPLLIHDRAVGALRLADPSGLALTPSRQRFLAAIAYYAALGVERVRLVAAAEHAEGLREADRLKDALLASVSHDLRTPLTAIKALAHDLALGGEERAAVIEQQADRLNRMVADLLDLSRLSAGGMPLESEVNAAEDLLGAALKAMEGALGGRQISTAIAWSEPVLLGRFDFVAALRILVNLIENAVKYAPAPAPIEVSVRRNGAWLEFAVADRGPGVAPSERERIFEPFYRAPQAPPDAGSAGLGLAISRRLAQAQGGALAYCERPGGGSLFTLRLPAAELVSS
ncbi:MAG: ATP-binding protein [Acidobacteriota bacterium]